MTERALFQIRRTLGSYWGHCTQLQANNLKTKVNEPIYFKKYFTKTEQEDCPISLFLLSHHQNSSSTENSRYR